jgi:ABC-type nitrate/sulfonate/bicarbonate transport system permease component
MAGTSGPSPERPAGRRRTRRLRRVLRSRQFAAVVSLTVVLGAWQLYGPSQPLFASYPQEILQAAANVLLPDILPSWTSTLWGFIVGLVISMPIAIVIGVAMGRSRLVDIILGPYVNALYVTPRIALIPVLVLWFGLDFSLRLSIVVLSAVFPMIINTYTGMKHVDRNLLDVGRAFTANARQRMFTIVLPGSLPYIFAGLRIGTARALGGVIVAEMTASFSGIGRRLMNYGTFYEIDKMFVAIVSIGVFGLLLARSVAWAQGRVAPWTHGVRTR